MAALFISDLHLCGQRPAMTALFQGFLGHCRRGVTLYILGDLFEAWLGDDAVLPEQRPVIDALRTTTARGVEICFMHGNRDFLVGEEFAAMTGVRLLPDPSVIHLDGQPVLLMHGDTLCTDDHDYQAYRARVRSAAFREEALALSVAERQSMAGYLRAESTRATRRKAAPIMDVNQQAVEQVMRAHRVRRLIHGHTHRQAIHEFTLDGQGAQRIVLGDWHREGSVLIHAAGRYRLENFTDPDVLAE